MRLLLDRLLLPAEVVAVRTLRPRLREITLHTDRALRWTPGQHIRVFFRAPSWLPDAVRAPSREYTVWDCRSDGRVVLRVFLHGNDGPGIRWARRAAVGDPVAITKPEGHLVPAAAASHLFIGEDTAAVAFGAILRALPPSAKVCGIIEVDDASNVPPMPRADDLTWVYRRGAPAAGSPRLIDATRGLPAQQGAAYLAGESRTCQLIRQVLMTEGGWNRRSITTSAFWTAGRVGA